MKPIGLFGGSFNPVHLGHLLVAQAACEELDLDRLYFVPAAQSPFKPGADLAPGNLRLRMLRLALAGCCRYAVDPQEISRGGVSYSIETIRDYTARFPGVKLYYFIGADHVPQLPKWRSADELAQRAEFVVIPRPGESASPWPAPFRGRTLQGFPLGVSSSQIRQRVRKGLPIGSLVPPAVAEAVRVNRLYI